MVRNFLLISLCMTCISAWSQTEGDYRSVEGGDWTRWQNWERFNGTEWRRPTGLQRYPGYNDQTGTVTIYGHHAMTLSETLDYSLGSLVIEGTNSASITLQLSNAAITITNDLTMQGTLPSIHIGGTTSGLTIAVNGNLVMSNTASFVGAGAGNLTVSGITTISGNSTFTDSDNTGVTTFIGAVTVSAGNTFTSTAVTTPANLIFRGGITNHGTFNAGAATFNTNNQSLSGSSAFSFANHVAITGATLTASHTHNLTITGTTTLSTNGGFTDSNNTGVTTFTGAVTVGTGTTFTSTVVITPANMIFRGGITNHGTFNAGAATFNTNNQWLSGSSAFSFANNVAITGVTLTAAHTHNLTISGTTTLSTGGGFTDSNNSGVTTFTGAVTVNTGTAFTSTAVTTPANMIFRGGITNHGTFNAGAATFNTNNQWLSGSSAFSFANNVAITGVTLTASHSSNLVVAGTTTLSTNGRFTDSNNTGIAIFVGRVTVNTGSIFTSTAVTTPANMIFRGGIVNNGTFSAHGATFDTNNQTLSGTGSTSFAGTASVAGITVTNNFAVTFTNAGAGSVGLNGSGTWQQGANSTLNYTPESLTVATFDAAGLGNTVNYNSTLLQYLGGPATYYHLTVLNAGTKYLMGNTAINGNLTIQNATVLDANGHNISIAGHWINSSSATDAFVEGTRTVTFNGVDTQSITRAGGETFYNLVVNTDAASSVQLQNDITVTQTLTLSRGGIDLNAKKMYITRADVSAMARTNGYIKSEINAASYSPVVWTIANATGSFIFPFGKSSVASDYIPFIFEVTSPGTGTSGTISVATYGTGSDNTPYPSGITNFNNSSFTNNAADVVDRFWIVMSSNYSTNPTATLTFTATPGEVGTITALRAQRWNGSWNDPLPAQSSTANSATVPNVNSFLVWTLSGNNTPLPVGFLDFKSEVINNTVLLQWATASETNNDYFTVERSEDGKHFQPIGQVPGKGTQQQRSTYVLPDTDPVPGKAYYRLKQTDYDGTSAYHPQILVVNVEGTPLGVYPNPFDGTSVQVKISVSENTGLVPLVVYDQIGKECYRSVIGLQNGYASQRVIFDHVLEEGIYILKIGVTGSMMQKLIVRH